MTQTTTELKSLIVRESKDLTITQKLARRGLLRAFSKARYGRLTIADGEDTFAFDGTESGHLPINTQAYYLKSKNQNRS